MADLFTFNSFNKQEKKLRIRTKSVIMSQFRNGPQLINNSDPLLVSSVNGSDVTNISEFDPVCGGIFDMSLR